MWEDERDEVPQLRVAQNGTNSKRKNCFFFFLFSFSFEDLTLTPAELSVVSLLLSDLTQNIFDVKEDVVCVT